MLHRLEAGVFAHIDDTPGRKTAVRIREALGLAVKAVRQVKVFTFSGLKSAPAKSWLPIRLKPGPPK